MELSILQQKILNAPNNKIVVLSSAASGKTRLMTEKVRQLLRAGVNPREIAVITFTNMAAAELKQRLGDDLKEGLFIGTIHALANYFLLSSGIKTDKVLDNEDFDALFDMVQDHPTCIRHMEWILLDEAQDSDPLQFKFLFDLINPDYFFVCGDIKQSIYQWKGSKPMLMMKLADRPDVVLFDMNENYRNGYNILNFAKKIISPTGLKDTSISMRKGNGSVREMNHSNEAIVQFIKENPSYATWAVLCRTNAEIEFISSYLKHAGIPCETFKQGDLSREELIQKMQQNTVKVLTIHSAKGLEWDNVIVVGARMYNSEERNVCYVAATRARDNLIWMSGNPKNNVKKYRW